MADCTCKDCSQIPNVPVCPDPPEYTNYVCPDTPSSSCIVYEGGSEPCIGIVSPDSNKLKITAVFKAIISYITSIFARFSSSSLSVVRSGDCGDILNIEVVPSSDTNNIFVLGTDGKPYVKRQEVQINDSQCITFQKQVTGSLTTIVPIIDFTCISTKVCGICAGTAVPCAAANVSIGTITQTGAIISFNIVSPHTYSILLNNILLATGISSPYTLTGLTPGMNYTVTIVTDCGSGNTSQTVVSFSTLPVVSCNVPLNLTIDLS